MVVARKALTGTVGFVVTMASDAAPVNAKGLVATLLLNTQLAKCEVPAQT